MTIYRIPVAKSVPDQRFSIELDGAAFNLRLRWNTTAATWFLDVLTSDDDTILAGRALLHGVFIGIRSVDPRKPRGGLMVFDTRRAPTGNVGLDELGDVVQLVWYDPAEIAAAAEGAA